MDIFERRIRGCFRLTYWFLTRFLYWKRLANARIIVFLCVITVLVTYGCYFVFY
jgi:hypothetical protein